MIELTEEQVTLIDVLKNIKAQIDRLPSSCDKDDLRLACATVETSLAFKVSNQLIDKLTGKGT